VKRKDGEAQGKCGKKKTAGPKKTRQSKTERNKGQRKSAPIRNRSSQVCKNKKVSYGKVTEKKGRKVIRGNGGSPLFHCCKEARELHPEKGATQGFAVVTCSNRLESENGKRKNQ